MIALTKLVLRHLTGEYLLDRHANSAEVILLRTVITSFFISVFALWLEQKGHWNLAVSTWPNAYLNHAAGHIPWLGAIAAAVYAAFYSRFASQWSYLADLYNQVKQKEASLPSQESSDTTGKGCPFATVAGLKAALIEDAKTLHLATHKSFKYAVATWSKEPCVVQAFAGTIDGERTRLKSIAGDAVREIPKPFSPRAPLTCRAFCGYREALCVSEDDCCSGFQQFPVPPKVATASDAILTPATLSETL